MPDSVQTFASFEAAAAFLRKRFACDAESAEHLRLQVSVASGSVSAADSHATDSRPDASGANAPGAGACDGAPSGSGSAAPRTHPVTVYRGRSAGQKEREQIHVASPLLGLPREAGLGAARAMDEMPLGGIRLLGELLHVHDSLPFPGVQEHVLEATVKLVAAEAATLTGELGGNRLAGTPNP